MKFFTTIIAVAALFVGTYCQVPITPELASFYQSVPQQLDTDAQTLDSSFRDVQWDIIGIQNIESELVNMPLTNQAQKDGRALLQNNKKFFRPALNAINASRNSELNATRQQYVIVKAKYLKKLQEYDAAVIAAEAKMLARTECGQQDRSGAHWQMISPAYSIFSSQNSNFFMPFMFMNFNQIDLTTPITSAVRTLVTNPCTTGTKIAERTIVNPLKALAIAQYVNIGNALSSMVRKYTNGKLNFVTNAINNCSWIAKNYQCTGQ